MQDAETVLEVLRERGRNGLQLTQLYRQMFNKSMYLLAYGNIYSNKGAMTPGVSGGTADGMSEVAVDEIIDFMRFERYRFAPARRVYIPKKNGKLRPLGIPSWRDKLVGEVVRLILEAIYEPSFSSRSHGFRKGRGCHTALRQIRETWTGTVWFIEGDISDCFGSIDHEILMQILGEKIGDQRFLRLIRGMLRAGYMEDWEYKETLSGSPQGGVVSPVLSNIYLHKLDEFVERELIPQYTRGKGRKLNLQYRRIWQRLAAARELGDRDQVRKLTRELRAVPSVDPTDPGYRRLLYCRYADDHLLGFIGPKAEAEVIKEKLAFFLRETLALELNPDKTLITHARTGAARFLGYEITVQHCDTQLTNGRRMVNGKVALMVPKDVIKAKCAPYRKQGKPWHRPRLQNLDDYDIVRIYGAEYRGVHGLAPSQIAELLDCHPATVRRWISRFSSEGLAGLADRPRSGRPRLGGRRLTGRIAALLARPGPWTLPRIRRYLGWPQVSMRTSYRRVRLVAIWRRPKLTARGDPDHDHVVAGIAARLIELPRRAVVLAEDETHLNLLPHVRASWTPRTARPQIPTPGTNRQITVFGALEMTTGAWVYRLGRRCAADFIALLDQLLRAFPRAPLIVVICDNDSIHHARKVTAYLETHPRLELLYGARYSPHDNPAERIWGALKNYVANTAVTWPARLRQIHSFFRARSPDQMLDTAAPWTSPWLPPGYEQNFWNAA